MNINVSLKDVLKFFTKLSFKIAFFIGIIIYKIFLLDNSNKFENNVVNIILIISIIFLVDDLINRALKTINKKVIISKLKKGLKKLSDPQIEILVSNYLILKNNSIIINPTAYFSLERGEYQILLSKQIIFRSATIQGSLYFPFTIQEWAYNEIDNAIKKKEIVYKKREKKFILSGMEKRSNLQKMSNKMIIICKFIYIKQILALK